MPPGLFRRNGRYYLRRRIPKALLEHYGRVEIVRALGTSDASKARLLHARATVALNDEFEAAKRGLGSKMVKNAGRENADPVIAQPEEFDADAFAARALATIRRKRDEAAKANDLATFNEWMREELGWQQSYLDNGPLLLDGETPEVAIRKAEGARTALRAMMTGEGIAALGTTRKFPASPLSNSGPRVSLTEVWKRWSAERNPKPRAVIAHERVIRRFEAVVGGVSVAELRKSHVLSFKDKLVAERQTPGNINVLLTRLNTLLNFAVNNDLASANVAKGIKVEDNRRRKDKRREWTAEALNLLFASPVYSQSQRPAAGGGEAAYWLPLLALYTGARQTELGQLHPDDVVEESYLTADETEKTAWVIRIVENEKRGQFVKNEGSERRVPIHADLIGLGFLELVQTAKRLGRERLFPDIMPGAHGELMGNWSKWFGRYRRAAGVTGAETPFHAFRHSFKHYARLSLISDKALNEFTGHETGETGDDYGGLSYPLAPLTEAIALYRVPGIRLPNRPPPGR